MRQNYTVSLQTLFWSPKLFLLAVTQNWGPSFWEKNTSLAKVKELAEQREVELVSISAKKSVRDGNGPGWDYCKYSNSQEN